MRSLIKSSVAVLLCCAALPAFAAGGADIPSGTESTNWAGYAATGAKYTGVGATWAVSAPKDATSSALATDATWVGIGGIRKQDLIQAGTQTVIKNGRVSYRAWYELLPDYQRSLPLDIHSGDKVQVALFEYTPGFWLLTFDNLTAGTQVNKVLQYKSTHASAEWIEEMPTVTSDGKLYAPLDEFGTLTFKDAYATVKSGNETPEDAHAKPITMVAGRGQVTLASPGKLLGDTFSVVRSSAKASQSSTKSSGIIWTQ